MWTVQPLQGKVSLAWVLCANSDAGGGFHEGCEHKHESAGEAEKCVEARIVLGSITGFPERHIGLAQSAYEAYCNHTGWKSLATGQDLPQWEALKPSIKAAWLVSVRAIRQLVLQTAKEQLG
jgi:hypothetical protein